MEFSRFGKKMTGEAGILSLMDDLGKAVAENSRMIMMGGGNPGRVDEFHELMRRRLQTICGDRMAFQRLVGNYSPPDGDRPFARAVASLLAEDFGWNVSAENICLTSGSQTAFFMLFNLFAGRMPDGGRKKICLPMAPEYIGYADVGMDDELFVSARPEIELLGETMFKYHIDFDGLKVDDEVAAICVSRPTNPTGNVITDHELGRLMEIARGAALPLIVDCAYGLPFPGMIYSEAKSMWNDDMILCLSLSKLGLPAVRTGIVVASPEIVRALAGMNAIMSLAPTNFGAVLVRQLMESGEIRDVAREIMLPFYRRKMELAVDCFERFFSDIPCRVHKPEGAMFLWLWFEDLPVSSLELYRQLKEHGVLVVSGHYFFPGLAKSWGHCQQCLRVTYSQDDGDVAEGLRIIAEVARRAYRRKR